MYRFHTRELMLGCRKEARTESHGCLCLADETHPHLLACLGELDTSQVSNLAIRTAVQAFNHVGEVRAAVGGAAMTDLGQEGLTGGLCDPRRLSERGAMRGGEAPSFGGCRVLRGPYLGDVSALCFLPSSPVSHLLAGTGAQVLLYDLATGDRLLCQQVFDGVRVHGIHVRHGHLVREPEAKIQVTVAVHGEGRVKVLELQHDDRKGSSDLKFCVVQSLPRFFQWILDVRFLQEDSTSVGEEQQALLAVGLSDNSVSIWNLRKCSPVLRVECSERCLLYSLRLWGSSVETLRVAAGTIFNKVLIWDAICWNDEDNQQKWLAQSRNFNDARGIRVPLMWTVEPLQELLGHEGSIHRISWSEDGLCVASASDDRSARVWTRPSTNTLFFTAGPVLYGHGARLWDCHIADNLLITSSEDCTSRVWTRQGQHLATLTGHTGRGIWRCVYDHESATLVTAGADSAIKVQLLARWSHDAQFCEPGVTSNVRSLPLSSSSNTEVFRISLVGPNILGEGSSTAMDSNSEYVRCLDLAGSRTLYIATNQGHIYHVALLDGTQQEWTEITHGEISGPIVCMNLLVDGAMVTGYVSDDNKKDEMVAFGNGSGNATALGIRIIGQQPIVIWQCKWLADQERQLLGIFWCKSLGRRFIFTTDPRGLVRVWLLKRCLDAQTSVEGQGSHTQALLLAVSQSPLQARIVCLDVCPLAELLVCGDQRGNLASFRFPKTFLLRHIEESSESVSQLQSIGIFRGAHGISAVASVSVTSSSNKQDAIISSTGRDGCICKFVVDTVSIKDKGQSSGQSFACSRVEDVTALTVVESVEYRQDQRKCGRRLAAGFIASNFILWDLTQQSEGLVGTPSLHSQSSENGDVALCRWLGGRVGAHSLKTENGDFLLRRFCEEDFLMRVTCGGWRRPHSYVVGDIPESQCCFAFLKDQVVYVHRNWAELPSHSDLMGVEKEEKSNSIKKLLSQVPQSLHGQFHGREIHSVHFVPAGNIPVSSGQHVRQYIATAAEDGAVRISRYDAEELSNLESYLLLGEHTGGSAVRAITLVQGAQTHVHYQPPSIRNLDVCMRDPLLLLSVGAKEVLTCWLLEWKQDPESMIASIHEAELISTVTEDNVNQSPVIDVLSSKWLCSYTPPRTAKLTRKEKESPSKNNDEILPKALEKAVDMQPKEKLSREESRTGTNDDDDLRFLAVTAMSIYSPDSGSVFYFAVTACSNATLRLIAMDLMTKIWVEVAVLEYHTVPVLALQHLVVPIQGGCQNACLIVSGATDGSIAVWDITNLVIAFTKHMLSGVPSLASSAGTQLRPRTGRGSQGGRRFRSAKQRQAGLPREKKIGKSLDAVEIPVDDVSSKAEVNSKESLDITAVGEANFEAEIGSSVQVGDVLEESGSLAYKSSVLGPLCTLTEAHQSGVNCLSAAKLVGEQDSVVVVVSGGDDQRIHVLRFELHPPCGEKHHKYAPAGEPSGGDVNGVATSSTEESQAEGRDDAIPQVQLALNSVSRASVEGAHNSAVKGIWTDGAWVFSTGLDQRLRCWHLANVVSHCGSPSYSAIEGPSDKRLPSLPLLECGHCVIDVPEAEDLHVQHGPIREQYCIAVGGRGLQVFDFASNW